jgi:hypothetical protein
MACLIVVFFAIVSQGNAIASFLALMPTLTGILASGAAGMFFLWASFALRVMVAIENNTHVSSIPQGNANEVRLVG